MIKDFLFFIFPNCSKDVCVPRSIWKSGFLPRASFLPFSLKKNLKYPYCNWSVADKKVEAWHPLRGNMVCYGMLPPPRSSHDLFPRSSPLIPKPPPPPLQPNHWRNIGIYTLIGLWWGHRRSAFSSYVISNREPSELPFVVIKFHHLAVLQTLCAGVCVSVCMCVLGMLRKLSCLLPSKEDGKRKKKKVQGFKREHHTHIQATQGLSGHLSHSFVSSHLLLYTWWFRSQCTRVKA